HYGSSISLALEKDKQMFYHHKPLKHNQPAGLRLRQLLTFPGPSSSSPNMFILVLVQKPEVLYLVFSINF
ncbi:hypothetical protein ILYODFUR_037993, partial [Ilyodon furcidens]